MRYKYVTWSEETDDSKDVEFTAGSDEEAKAYALANDAQINDYGEPYLYRENEQTSRFGCGIDSCNVCNAWLDISVLPTIHGARLVCG